MGRLNHKLLNYRPDILTAEIVVLPKRSRKMALKGVKIVNVNSPAPIPHIILHEEHPDFSFSSSGSPRSSIHYLLVGLFVFIFPNWRDHSSLHANRSPCRFTERARAALATSLYHKRGGISWSSFLSSPKKVVWPPSPATTRVETQLVVHCSFAPSNSDPSPVPAAAPVKV